MRPSRKSAQDCKSGEKSQNSGTRRPHRLFHSENDTPVIVQAALLPIELSKPTISSSNSHHQIPESIRRITPSPSQPLEPDFAYQRPRPPIFPAPPPSPPASFLPPPPFPPLALQSAKFATVDHTTIPPPATVQEPITSAPYGGGQPPARTTNPPVAAYPSAQTPPYSNPLSPPTQPCASSQSQTQAHSQPQCPTQPQFHPQKEDTQTSAQPAAPYPQPRNPAYSQQPRQSVNQPAGPQPRARSQTQPQPIPLPQTGSSPQSPTQSRTQPAYPPPANSPRLPFPNNRASESGTRNSSTPQPYSGGSRTSSYPPSKPVLPMPKPPPHLLHILQQQEEQRKQQHFFLLQQQLQSMQNIQQQVNTMIDEGPQRYQSEAEHQRASSAVESRLYDLDRDSEDTEFQSNNDNTRTSIKQRPRLNKRIVTVSPHESPHHPNTHHHSTQPTQGNSGQVPQPASGTTSSTPTGENSNPNQRICTVPPHPYGTIIPRFATQHAFNVSHQANRAPLGYSSQPPPRPEYLQNPLPGPTVAKPMTSNFGTNCYQNTPSKLPENHTRNTICQTDPQIDDNRDCTSRPQPFPTKHETEARDEPVTTSAPEPPHQNPQPTPQSSEATSLQQPSQQTQGIQARLSHAQPLHSPALQTTHVMGSIQMIQNPPVKYHPMNNECAHAKQDDFYVPVKPPGYSMQSASLNRTSFCERNSGQIFLQQQHQQQQQSFQMQQWQQLHRQAPSPQSYVQLGTFPPSMANFARPPSGAFVQNIAERPLKLSLPSQVQTTQLYPQNFSNVGVGIRSANSCPGDVRIGAFHPGLMHGHRPGSPHHARARSAGRVSASESTASVWGTSSNPHHLP